MKLYKEKDMDMFPRPKVKIKRLFENVKEPYQATAGSACRDLHAHIIDGVEIISYSQLLN